MKIIGYMALATSYVYGFLRKSAIFWQHAQPVTAFGLPNILSVSECYGR